MNLALRTGRGDCAQTLQRCHRRQLNPAAAKLADQGLRERHALCRLSGHGQYMLDHFVVVGAIERFHPEQGR
jgi:hypothetical protein